MPKIVTFSVRVTGIQIDQLQVKYENAWLLLSDRLCIGIVDQDTFPSFNRSEWTHVAGRLDNDDPFDFRMLNQPENGADLIFDVGPA